MKSFIGRFLAIVLCGGVFAASGLAQVFNLQHPELMVDSLNRALSLTADQQLKATEIVTRAASDLLALPESERLKDSGSIRPRMRTEIRAILTPAQLRKYDRTPQIDGGGLTLSTPENRVARLDALVTLTPEQKVQAKEIFAREFAALLDLAEAVRAQQGTQARQAARAQIREILTTEQRAKYDAVPQGQDGSRTTRG